MRSPFTLTEGFLLVCTVATLGYLIWTEYVEWREEHAPVTASSAVPRTVSIFCDPTNAHFDHGECDGNINYPYGVHVPCHCDCHA